MPIATMTENERWGLKYDEPDYPEMTAEQVEWSQVGRQRAATILAYLQEVGGDIGVDLSKTEANIEDVRAMHNCGMLVLVEGTGDQIVFFN